MVLVAQHFNIIVGEVVNVRFLWVELQGWQRQRFSRYLQPCLVEMVVVEVRVAEGVDKNTGFKTAHLSHHVREQGVGCNVERDAKEDISAALVKLAV